MPTPYKLTTRQEAALRREKTAFKKLKTQPEKFAFLATCTWFPMEFWQSGQNGFRWFPTAAFCIMLDDAHPHGFATPEEAVAHGEIMKAEYKTLAAQPAL